MNRIFSSLFVLLFISCQSPYNLTRKISDHYVIIYIATESIKPLDPVDKNVFLIEAAAVYSEFTERGVPPENIYVLYYNSQPDWDETTLNSMDKKFKDEFSGAYNNSATVSNLIKIEDEIDDKLKPNSVLHLVMNAHGRIDSAGFYMHSELDNRFIRKDLLNDLIKDNQGITHLFVGSCFSGKLLSEIDEGTGLIVTGASDKGACWLDRENSFGRIYFSSLPVDLDPSKYKSSYSISQSEYKTWGSNRSQFINNEYKTTKKEELKTLVWEPMFKRLGN